MSDLFPVSIDLALNESGATGAAPEWVQLVPPGQIEGRDGRSYVLADPEGVIADFKARALDLVVDFEHQNDTPAARLAGPVPAAGWIKELQCRKDGLWGRVEWTAQAAGLIAEKAYRYLSPVILHSKDTREIRRLKGASLVHSPNFLLKALNSQEAQMTPVNVPTPTSSAQSPQDLLQSIISFFGLPPNSTVEEVIQALKAVKDKLSAPPDPAKYMPVDAVTAMMAERSLELAEAREGRAQEKVNAAFRQGYINGGMRDWALSLCRSDEAAFDTFLEKSGRPFVGLLKNHGAAMAGVPPAARGGIRSDAADSIRAQLGLSSDTLLE